MKHTPDAQDIQRFESKFNKGKPDQCWEWIGGLKPNGYGHFGVWRTNKNRGKIYYAHRFAYTVYRHEIPKGQLVRHTCDNRRCVNPDHLILGSHKDNSGDMVARGRSRTGVRHHNTKLSDANIRYILKHYKVISKNESNGPALAKKFGVHRDTISRLVAGKGRVNLHQNQT